MKKKLVWKFNIIDIIIIILILAVLAFLGMKVVLTQETPAQLLIWAPYLCGEGSGSLKRVCMSR
jgi:hypothetical protein